jgi:hypothetical protein
LDDANNEKQTRNSPGIPQENHNMTFDDRNM